MANSASLLQSLVGPQKPKDLFTSLLLKGALDSSPVQHWSQGLGRMAQALLGGAMMRDDDRESEAALQVRQSAPGLGQVLAQPQAQPQSAITSGPRPANAPPLTVGGQEPRGIRNNNPGNIEAGAFAAGQPGFSGSDGRFARFQTPQQGMDAAGNLLNIYGQKHGINTVAGVINRWAPASDGNPVSAYASHVAQAMGVGPNDPINLADPAVRQKMAQAMAHFENGRPVQVAQAQTQQRNQVQIPPEVAAHIQRLYATRNPANIQQADALYQQYAKPREEWTPLTNPQDRARAGIQATDTNPYQRSAAGEVKAVNPQPFAVNVNQQGQSEFEKDYGSGLSKRALGVLERGDAAAIQKQRVMLAQRMLEDIQTGKITPAVATIGAYMQSMGIDPQMFGIKPETPMTAEALTAITSELVVGKIGAGGFPANNFSNPDREFLVQGVFKLADRPEANWIKLEVARRVAELDEQKADAWAEARANKQSYEDFERNWRKQLGTRSVFGDLIEQAKAFGERTGSQSASGRNPSIDAAVEEARKRKLIP